MGPIYARCLIINPQHVRIKFWVYVEERCNPPPFHPRVQPCMHLRGHDWHLFSSWWQTTISFWAFLKQAWHLSPIKITTIHCIDGRKMIGKCGNCNCRGRSSPHIGRQHDVSFFCLHKNLACLFFVKWPGVILLAYNELVTKKMQWIDFSYNLFLGSLFGVRCRLLKFIKIGDW